MTPSYITNVWVTKAPHSYGVLVMQKNTNVVRVCWWWLVGHPNRGQSRSRRQRPLSSGVKHRSWILQARWTPTVTVTHTTNRYNHMTPSYITNVWVTKAPHSYGVLVMQKNTNLVRVCWWWLVGHPNRGQSRSRPLSSGVKHGSWILQARWTPTVTVAHTTNRYNHMTPSYITNVWVTKAPHSYGVLVMQKIPTWYVSAGGGSSDTRTEGKVDRGGEGPSPAVSNTAAESYRQRELLL